MGWNRWRVGIGSGCGIEGFLFLFRPHSQENSLLSTSQRQRSSNRANVPRTC